MRKTFFGMHNYHMPKTEWGNAVCDKDAKLGTNKNYSSSKFKMWWDPALQYK